jgi:endo-alpha-1,4-polygalactosaminidase (GH114 family)
MIDMSAPLVRFTRIFVLYSCFIAVVILASCKSPEPTLAPRPTSPVPVSEWWHPQPGLTWQWQLDGELDISVEAEVYDLDLYVDQEAIDALHARGAMLICYISVGSYEDWRPDANQFPGTVIGNRYGGWSGERWLDIRRIDLLSPVMCTRLDLCAEKRFDGVEPDNIDIYGNKSGFDISYREQLAYLHWLADEAHARGLAIGLKNAPDMVSDSSIFLDFAITEDAYYYDWIDAMLIFLDEGKPVFAAEYSDTSVHFGTACQRAKRTGVSLILKDRDLTAFRATCR